MKLLFFLICVCRFPAGGSLVDTGSAVIWLGFWLRVSISVVSIIDTCTIPALALGHGGAWGNRDEENLCLSEP